MSAARFDYVPKQLSTSSFEIIHIRADLLPKNPRSRAIAAISPFAPDIKTLLGPRPRRCCHRREGVGTDSAAFSSRSCRAHSDRPTHAHRIHSGFCSASGSALFDQSVRGHAPRTDPCRRRLHRICGHADACCIPSLGFQTIITLDRLPAEAQHVPSVDVLITPIAQVYQHRVIGVIMTGMGSEGVKGMTAIFRQGGLTIGQDEASCAAYGMPRACAERGVLTRVVPLSDIPPVSRKHYHAAAGLPNHSAERSVTGISDMPGSSPGTNGSREAVQEYSPRC